MKRLVVLVLLAGACADEKTTLASRWTAREYLARHDDDVDFGGFLPRELAVTEG